MQSKQYILLFLAVLIFIALVAGSFYEYSQAVYLLDDELFWKRALWITGSVIVVIFLVLTRFVKPWIARIQLFLFCLLICGVFIPAFILSTNRLIPKNDLNIRKFEFYSLEAKGVGPVRKKVLDERAYPNGYYVVFVRKNKLDRIFTQKPRFLRKERGDIIELRTRTGLWGYEYVIWN